MGRRLRSLREKPAPVAAPPEKRQRREYRGPITSLDKKQAYEGILAEVQRRKDAAAARGESARISASAVAAELHSIDEKTWQR